MSSKFKPDEFDFMKEVNTPSEMSMEMVDAQIYGGGVGVRESGRMVGQPTDIMTIWADVAQPRRAIPNSVRLYWNGNPEQVVALLKHWQKVAEQKAGAIMPLLDILNGQGEGQELEAAHPHLAEFIELLRLAQSIHREGLINPISVIRRGDSYVIESGERRWLAHHLLNEFIDAKYGKIPAIESKSGESVWRQARENTARRSLNAIGMARQLALLIMDLRSNKTDYDRRSNQTDYNRFEDIVEGCDRIFYEQVANAQQHNIPKGMGERVQSAMGVKRRQISNYRSLLRLTEDHEVNDIIWLRADEESWALDPLIQIGELPLETLRRIVVDNPAFTFNELMAEVRIVQTLHNPSDSQPVDDTPKPTAVPRHQLTPGTIIRRDMGNNTGDYWRIEEADYMNDVFMCVSPSGFKQRINYSQITAIATDKRDLFKAAPKTGTTTSTRKEQSSTPTPVDYKVGDRVIIDGNPAIRGTIANQSRGNYQVNFLTGGSRWFEGSRLTPAVEVPKTSSGERFGTHLEGDDYTTPLADDEMGDDFEYDDEEDYDDSDGGYDGEEELDFEPFSMDNIELLNTITDAIEILDIPESEVIADLCILDKNRIRYLLELGGMEAVENAMNKYRTAVDTAVEQIRQRIDLHLRTVRDVAQQIIEE